MQKDIFFNEISKNKLYELIRIPFYLTHIVSIFKKESVLPKTKSDLFQKFIDLKISEDISHYKTTIDLSKEKNRITELLTKIAITMETLGRNYINESELERFIERGDKELLNYTGLFLYSHQENYWMFQHNNFQEYLAAHILSRSNLKIIKQFIAFAPDYNKIIPSWTNTLSFLSTLYNKDDLINWLLISQPEILVRFEKDRISPELRHEIFVKIFNYYKERKIWIDRDKYDLIDLGKFASDDVTIDFLIKEAESKQDDIIRANAIMLLGFVENISTKYSEIIKTLLIEIIHEHKAENLVTRSINALNNLSIHDKETVDIILQSLENFTSAHIRSCLYNIVQSGNTANEYVEILLEGIKFIRANYKGDEKSTLVDEGYYLGKALEQLTSEQSVIRLLEYFIKNPKDLSEVSLSKTSKAFSKNIANLIKKNESIVFELAFNFIMKLGELYILEYTREFLNCFRESGTSLIAFIRIFEGDFESGKKYNVLSLLADEECINYTIDNFQMKKFTSNDISLLRNFLMGNQPELSKYFDQRLKQETNFLFPKRIDFEAQRNRQRKRDFEMIFDKSVFIKEIRMVFENEKKTTITEDEIRDLELKNWENSKFANKALDIIKDYSRNNNAVLSKILKDYENTDFDFWFIREVYNWLEHNDDMELEKSQTEKIITWCYNNVDQVDFRKALNVSPGRQFQTSEIALYTWFFMRKFNLKYSERIFLDMLSFDWHGAGIEYLTNKLDLKNITQRIIQNLESNNENEIAIQNYFTFGRNQKINEFVFYARKYLGYQSLDSSCREAILDYLIELDNTDEGLEQALIKTEDDFKWQIVEKLVVKKNKSIDRYLLRLLTNGLDEDKLLASQYLIELQNIEGLIYFKSKLGSEMKFLPRWYHRKSLRDLVIKEAIPHLLEMLELTYNQKFIQADYERLEGEIYDAFKNIAIQSEENYLYVKSELETFIKEKRHIDDRINFIYAFLERLEQTFYVNKSQNITIDMVIDKLKLLYS